MYRVEKDRRLSCSHFVEEHVRSLAVVLFKTIDSWKCAALSPWIICGLFACMRWGRAHDFEGWEGTKGCVKGLFLYSRRRKSARRFYISQNKAVIEAVPATNSASPDIHWFLDLMITSEAIGLKLTKPLSYITWFFNFSRTAAMKIVKRFANVLELFVEI